MSSCLFPISISYTVRPTPGPYGAWGLRCVGSDPTGSLADMYLMWADDNYAVRVAYVRATGERPGGVSLLTRPRHQVERALAQARTKKQD
ncbi:MAG: hypothetical protein ACXWO1_09570 [Isosphaeraceae bacterium]